MCSPRTCWSKLMRRVLTYFDSATLYWLIAQKVKNRLQLPPEMCNFAIENWKVSHVFCHNNFWRALIFRALKKLLHFPTCCYTSLNEHWVQYSDSLRAHTAGVPWDATCKKALTFSEFQGTPCFGLLREKHRWWSQPQKQLSTAICQHSKGGSLQTRLKSNYRLHGDRTVG